MSELEPGPNVSFDLAKPHFHRPYVVAANPGRVASLPATVGVDADPPKWRQWLPYRGRLTLLSVLIGLPLGMLAQTDPIAVAAPVPPAPPPAWPMVTRPDAPMPPTIRPHGATRYSIGNPTGEEQLYLEYINRARANPAAEGVLLANAGADYPEVQSAYDYFGVDLAKMMNEFAAINPAPPLSFNELLIDAARLHSQDMLDNTFQGHHSWNTATDAPDLTKDPGYRLDQVNYPWNQYGENVFSSAKSPFHGHAGFEVDWGNTPDGMQGPPRGHRESIHSPDFREVGIGVLNGSNHADGPPSRDVGPQLVTQDFGSQFNLDPFITGVAYYDLNGNDFYDVGEGIGGATVDVAGSQFHAVTVNSGGYSVPVPANMSHTVTLSGPGFADDTQTISVGADNVKVDYQMAYDPPVISGPSVLGVGQAGAFSFTPVGGATGYRWSQAILTSTDLEGAENGAAHLQVAITPGYNVIDTSIQASGAASFHLAMPEQETQTLDLNQDFRPGSQAQLMFASQLGWATVGQIARAQVSEDGGASWSDLWSRAGTDNVGQSGFETVTVPLADFAGQVIRVRFQYTVSGGWFPQTDSGVGWNFDDIQFDDVARLEQSVAPQEMVDTSFAFSASAEGTYLLQAQPQVSGRWLPAGPEKLVDVSGTAPPVVTIGTVAPASGGGLRIECSVANGSASAVRLDFLDDLSSAWAEDTGAQMEVIEAGVRYGFDVPAGTATHRFYQVVVDP